MFMPHFFLAPAKTTETSKIAKNLKKSKVYYPNIIYLHNVSELKKNLKATDVLEIHADGEPWVMGAQSSTNYDYSPYALAKVLIGVLEGKDLDIIIDLRFCNSGTKANGSMGPVSYAESLSKFLAQAGYTMPRIYGYMGYVHSERPLKQSLVSEHEKHGAKVKHCRLEDGCAIYQNGELLKQPLKVLVSDYEYEDGDFSESEVICQQVSSQSSSQVAMLANMLDQTSDYNDNIKAMIDEIIDQVDNLSIKPLLLNYASSSSDQALGNEEQPIVSSCESQANNNISHGF